MSTNLGELISQGKASEAVEALLQNETVEGDTSLEAEAKAEAIEPDPVVEAEPEIEAASPEVAPVEEEQAAAPEDDSSSMWDQKVSEDDPFVTNKFFKGRKLREVYKSAESNWERADKFRRENDELKQKVAAFEAVDTYVQRVKEAADRNKPPEDPWKARGVDLQTDPIADPQKFAQALEEIVAEKVSGQITGKLDKRRESEAETTKQETYEKQTGDAIREAKAALTSRGVSSEQFDTVLPWMMNDIYQNNPEYLMVPNNYLLAFEKAGQVFNVKPSPETAEVKAAAPTKPKPVAAPPGAKRPSGSKEAPRGKTASLPSGMDEYLANAVEELAGHGVVGFNDKEAANKYMREHVARSLGGS